MTLRINVLRLLGKHSNGDLYMSGKKTGTYKIEDQFGADDQRRLTLFVENQTIQFSLYERGAQPEPKNRKAFIIQPCELIKQFIVKNRPQDSQPKKYDIQLYNENDEPMAIVYMEISYKRALLFQGMFPSMQEIKQKTFKFYKGVNMEGGKNIFNFLDYCCQSDIVDQEFKPIQTIYKDKFY